MPALVKLKVVCIIWNIRMVLIIKIPNITHTHTMSYNVIMFENIKHCSNAPYLVCMYVSTNLQWSLLKKRGHYVWSFALKRELKNHWHLVFTIQATAIQLDSYN